MEEEVVGLTLFLAGAFDPHVLIQNLSGLRPLRYERTSDGMVTVLHKAGPPYRFSPSRPVECDRVKFSVPGPRSIRVLFDALLSAINGLSPANRAIWNALTERTADLGIKWTNCSNCGTEYDIAAPIIKSLSEARVALRISVYATSGALDKALRERAESESHSQDRNAGPP